MAIINRLARLFKADFHAVLDHIEEPELQLKQSIREMDEQLQTHQSDIRRLTLKSDEFSKRKMNAQTLLEKTNREITVCLEGGNDGLAKGLIRRKLETKAIIHSLNNEIENIKTQIDILKKESDEFSSVLNNMQQKAALMTSQPVSSKVTGDDFLQVNDSDVEIALLHEKQRFDAQLKTS